MKDFDIEIGFNGDINFEPFEGDEEKSNSLDKEINKKVSNDKKSEPKKSWTDTLSNLTKKYKELSGFKTNEQLIAEKKQERLEKGTKYKVIGMNPFIAVGLSFAIIIAGSVVVTKLKAN
jgi:hypothetical protein